MKHARSTDATATAPTPGFRKAEWLARIALIIVFGANVQCALGFIISPQAFIGAYELSGEVGIVAIQAIGIAFLMWNATYPLPIVHPLRHRTLFGVVLAQQVIGVVGELAILFQLPAGHETLARSIRLFSAFDIFGLVIMGASFAFLLIQAKRADRDPETH